MAGRVVIFVVLISVFVFGAPSVTEMVQMGYNLEYIARYIITHASEFEPFQVEAARVFLGAGVSGAVTGTAALSVWAKVASVTAWGIIAGLAVYDIVKAYQLISALVELNDIKKGIAAVREVQRYDVLGIQMMSGMGKYKEYFVIVESGSWAGGSGFETYKYSFISPKYYDGENIRELPGGSWLSGTYYSDGNKRVWGISGGPTAELIDFLYTTGIYSKTVEIFLSGSYYAPARGRWMLSSPGWGKIVAGVPLSGSNRPLFSENQPVGIVTTVDGFSLFHALKPEQWGNVRNLSDIRPVLKFVYMPYGAYRNVPSYDNAPIEEKFIDTSKVRFEPDSGVWNTFSPEPMQQIQQQLQSIAQTVQGILPQLEQVKSIPELQEKYQALQQTQVELSGLVQTLSETISRLKTQTETNAEAIGRLQEQLNTAVQLMNSVQTALETVNQLKNEVETLRQQLNGVVTENDVIVQNLEQVQTALRVIEQEFPQLKQQVQVVFCAIGEVEEKVERLVESQNQTQQEYRTIIEKIQNVYVQIQALMQHIQNMSVNIDLTPVVNAVNQVGEKLKALSERVAAMDEYFREGFFEKLGEKMKEILEKLFIPKEGQLEKLLRIDLPDYRKEFVGDVSFSSQTTSIPISLFGASVDLAEYITRYSSGLRTFMNIFVSGLAAVFVIRAFRVYLNID